MVIILKMKKKINVKCLIQPLSLTQAIKQTKKENRIENPESTRQAIAKRLSTGSLLIYNSEEVIIPIEVKASYAMQVK